MTFFTDENVATPLGQMLRLFDRRHDILLHADRFDPGTPDDVWMPELAHTDPGAIVISGDGRIVKNPALKVVARQSRLSFVVLGESFMRTAWHDQAWKLIKAWPEIVKATSAVRRPTIFDLTISSLKVTIRLGTDDLK